MKRHLKVVVALGFIMLDACSSPNDTGYPVGDQTASSQPGTGPTEPSTNIFDTPLTCTSGTYENSEESPTMKPGGACISCHMSSGEGPRYQIAGTVYPTAHELDDCSGVDGTASGAQVIVVDATGAEIVLAVNSAGNFYSRENIVFPYNAKVVQGGQERAMLAAQQSGDCNACHTESGANRAPGRIMLP